MRELWSIYSSAGPFHVWIFKHKPDSQYSSFCWDSFPTSYRNLISANSDDFSNVSWIYVYVSGMHGTAKSKSGVGREESGFGQGFLSILTYCKKPSSVLSLATGSHRLLSSSWQMHSFLYKYLPVSLRLQGNADSSLYFAGCNKSTPPALLEESHPRRGPRRGRWSPISGTHLWHQVQPLPSSLLLCFFLGSKKFSAPLLMETSS